ncbi:MAG: hypothetical protein ACOCYT_01995 [Chloroflexota bacterium]
MKTFARMALVVLMMLSLSVAALHAQDEDMADEVVGTLVQAAASAELTETELALTGVSGVTPAMYMVEDETVLAQIDTVTLDNSWVSYKEVESNPDGEALVAHALLETTEYQIELRITPVGDYSADENTVTYEVLEVVSVYIWETDETDDKLPEDTVFEGATLFVLGDEAFFTSLEEGLTFYLNTARPSGLTFPCIKGLTC